MIFVSAQHVCVKQVTHKFQDIHYPSISMDNILIFLELNDGRLTIQNNFVHTTNHNIQNYHIN